MALNPVRKNAININCGFKEPSENISVVINGVNRLV